MTDLYVTQQAITVLTSLDTSTELRVTAQGIDVATDTTLPASDLHVTQQAVSVMTNYVDPTNVRVTSQGIDVATDTTLPASDLHVTQQAITVLTSWVKPPELNTYQQTASALLVDSTSFAVPPNLAVTQTVASALLLDSTSYSVPPNLSTKFVTVDALVMDSIPSAKMTASVNGTAIVTGLAHLPFVGYLSGSASASAIPYLVRPTGRRQIINNNHVAYTGTIIAPPPPPPDDDNVPVTNITLTGISMFGTRSVTSWHSDDYVAQIADDTILPTIGAWGLVTDSRSVALKRATNSNSRVVGKAVMQNATDMDVQYSNAPLRLDLGSRLGSLEPLYISTWVKMHNTVSASASGTWKMLRLSSDETLVDDAGNFVFTRIGSSMEATPFNAINNSGVPFTMSQDGASELPELGQGTWTRMEFIIIPSTIKERDGSFYQFLHDNDGVEPVGEALYSTTIPSGTPWFNDGDVELYSANSKKDQYQYVIFQNYIRDGSGSNALNYGVNSVFMDSIFVQRGGLKRVEVANSADYNAATHREVQRVDAWSNEEISVNLLRGSLPNGVHYLHVIDDNNESMYYEPIELTTSGFILQASVRAGQGFATSSSVVTGDATII